jgi:DNA-binding transcriptional LysR family regulator
MIDDLELVRTFLVVLEEGSFSAAAPRTFRSQAAVSQQIRRLELQLGESLYIRSNRQLQLTLAGQRFLPHARGLLRASAQARLAARGDQRRLIRIGAADELVQALVMPVLKRLRAGHAEWAFEITTGPTRTLYPMLATRLDLLVGLDMPEQPGGIELVRWPLTWFGVRPDDGPLPLALCLEGCLQRERIVATLDEAGMAWEVAVAASSMAVVEAALDAGMAVSALMEPLAASHWPRTPNLPPLGDIGIRLHASHDVDDVASGFIQAAEGPMFGRKRAGHAA